VPWTRQPRFGALGVTSALRHPRRAEEVTAPSITFSRRKWILFRFDLPEGAQAVKVVARDDSDGD